MRKQQLLELLVKKDDPIDRQDWRSIRRECLLVSQLINAGLNALEKANYKDGEGYYYNAFFNLSIGIERLAKLIWIADYIIENNGQLPSGQAIKNYGHNLTNLLTEVGGIATKHNLELTYSRPDDDISNSIIRCLDSFANAREGRYANLNNLDGSNAENEFEPIKKWWNEVATPILGEHYFGTNFEKKVQQDIEQYLKSPTEVAFFIFYMDELGETINTLQDCWARDGQTEIVQKFDLYYTLRIVRWVADVFFILSRNWGWGLGECSKFDALFNHFEHFTMFRSTDEELQKKINQRITPPENPIPNAFR